ncbi:MAG: hypothetical protein PHV33_08780 [Elusimicrobiales bacterium]|nr:hypothetical protein [Elusimicrobiales bacterium]
MTMNYLGYVIITGGAALAAAAICFTALWYFAPALLARVRPEAAESAPAAAPESAPALRAPAALLDFTPEQAPALAALLEKESDEDIGLVLSQLPAPSGLALLSALPEGRRAGALLGLASAQAPDLDLLRAIKGELENRLYGKQGGPGEAAALLKALPYAGRKALLDRLCALDAARGAEVRAQVPLAEDLQDLTEKDLAALAAAVQPEKMGAFLSELPEKLRTRLKAAYTGKAAQDLEKAEARVAAGKAAGAPPGDLLELVEKLQARGIVGKPAPKVKAAPAAPAPAAKDDWG